MNNSFDVLGIILGIFILMVISVLLGRALGKWKITHDPKHKLEVVTVAEGAVFALLGLLIAFTFTGAYERYEAREYHIINEANGIATAFARLDLLEPVSRVEVQKTFKEYVDARVALFSHLTDADNEKVQTLKKNSRQLQRKLWSETLASLQATNNQASTMLVVPAISNMFEVANTREAIQKIHLPGPIIGLLIILAMISSFFSGYTTARKRIHSSVYILSYIIIITLTLYIIIDLEFPRSGLIRVQGFEEVLRHAQNEVGEMTPP